MTMIAEVRDDFPEAASVFSELCRVPVQDGHIMLALSDGVPRYEYVGQHEPEPGDLFSALCPNCPEVHLIALRSADAWHVAIPTWETDQ